MSEKTLEELKQEATDLGISFSQNIGADKLAAKIEEFYKSQETSAVVVTEVETKAEKSGALSFGEIVKQLETDARKTRIVTIIDNDQRENNYTTVVSVNCSNDYFDLGTRRIPLNVPVEVEQGFINVLKEVIIPMHIRGTDGNARLEMRPRYALSYDDDLKK